MVVKLLLLISVLFLLQGESLCENETNTPLVMWHGMSSSALNLRHLKKITENEIPGIYIYNIMIGENFVQDTVKSILGNAKEQMDFVCETIQNDTRLQNGYNAVGISQGGQFLRGLAQRCPNPQMKTLVTLGSQHQGVFGIPGCDPEEIQRCDQIRRSLHGLAYNYAMQRTLIQAQYWHDVYYEDDYARTSTFIGDLNNEKRQNDDYKQNLMNLEKLVLVMFLNDSVVIPRESGWFGFYKPGDTSTVQTMFETDLYKEDRLGLIQMLHEAKIDFLSYNDEHVTFTDEWYINAIVRKYFID